MKIAKLYSSGNRVETRDTVRNSSFKTNLLRKKHTDFSKKGRMWVATYLEFPNRFAVSQPVERVIPLRLGKLHDL